MSEFAPSQNPEGWKALHYSLLWKKGWDVKQHVTVITLSPGKTVNCLNSVDILKTMQPAIMGNTSCAHQAQLGWIKRHSSQDVALPLIHIFRPEVRWEKIMDRVSYRAKSDMEKQSLIYFHKVLKLGSRLFLAMPLCCFGNVCSCSLRCCIVFICVWV